MPEDASTAVNAKPGVAQRWGGRVPIVIGATGHRNIHPADGKLAAALRAECRKLKRQYGSSPFIVLSALAEGADRLIARTAMEELQADLIAVLPMPAADYERDFETEDSKDEFRGFLKRALWIRYAAVPEGDAWGVDGEPRNEQYARAGAMIVDHAQILLSVWDGRSAQGTGGTADQVLWFQRGYSPNRFSLAHEVRSRLDPAEPGRSVSINPATQEVTIVENPEAPAGAKSKISAILKRINRYNKNIKFCSAPESGPLIPDFSSKCRGLELTHSVYSLSDSSSARLSKIMLKSDICIYLLAIVAIIAFNFVSNKSYAPNIYLSITVVMLVIAGFVRLWSIENKSLEYRGLAEVMRTIFFWRCSGVKGSAWVTFASRQAGVLHWIRQAVRNIEFCQDCYLDQEKIVPDPDGINLAKIWWVDGQKNWFARKEQQNYFWYKIWMRISRLALGASFATAVVLAALTFLHSETGGTLWERLVLPPPNGDLWQVALGLFAGGGFAARGFLSRRAYLELTKQYASQRRTFETASQMLDAIETFPSPLTRKAIYEMIAAGVFQDASKERLLGAAFRAVDVPLPKELHILEKLGEEALEEQGDWIRVRYTRPFEVPLPSA